MKWGIAGLAAVAAVGLYLSLPPAEQVPLPPEDSSAIAIVNPPAELSAIAQAGEIVFNASCASCHGPNAEGIKGVAPPLVHKIYQTAMHADFAFVLAVQNGVRAHHWRFGNMPKVEGLSREDVQNVATYVRELQSENGVP